MTAGFVMEFNNFNISGDDPMLLTSVLHGMLHLFLMHCNSTWDKGLTAASSWLNKLKKNPFLYFSMLIGADIFSLEFM